MIAHEKLLPDLHFEGEWGDGIKQVFKGGTHATIKTALKKIGQLCFFPRHAKR